MKQEFEFAAEWESFEWQQGGRMSGVKIGFYHRCILIAECNTASEAWDKARTWRSILSPVEVRKVANNSGERISTNAK